MIARTTRTALCALVALLALPSAAGAALPDLVSDPPTNPSVGVMLADGTHPDRLLLRFDSAIHNVGPGPVELLATLAAPGSRQVTGVRQIVDGAERPMPGAQIVFEDGVEGNSDGHDHFHLQRAARYSLVLGGALVAPAAKVGFCLLDYERVESTAPPGFDGTNCYEVVPGRVRFGISPGYKDVYGANLAFQWVDVSNVAPGAYTLRSEVDPDDLIDEVDEANPPGGTPAVVPGHRARPLALAAGTRSFALAADAFAAAGAPEFRIVEAPRHGRLSRPAGAWFAGGEIAYTPDDPDDPRPDVFRYAARSAGSPFPREAPAAAVTVGAHGVAISGAPAEMVAATSVQLRARRGATWSATAGRVTDAGLFTAPAAPGTVVVRARDDEDGTADEVAIRVLGAPPAGPAPTPGALGPRPPAVPAKAIESARARRVGRWIAVTARTGRGGRLRVALRRGDRTVTACATRARAGRSYTCRLTRPRRGRGALRVVVQLRPWSGRAVSRRVPIKGGHVH